MNVGHIKPLHRHWHLRLAPGNLQTLCALCNHGKGGTDKDLAGEVIFRGTAPTGTER